MAIEIAAHADTWADYNDLHNAYRYALYLLEALSRVSAAAEAEPVHRVFYHVGLASAQIGGVASILDPGNAVDHDFRRARVKAAACESMLTEALARYGFACRQGDDVVLFRARRPAPSATGLLAAAA